LKRLRAPTDPTRINFKEIRNDKKRRKNNGKLSRRNLLLTSGIGVAAAAIGGTAFALENAATAANAGTLIESKVLQSKTDFWTSHLPRPS